MDSGEIGGMQKSDAVHVGVANSLREGGLLAPAIHDTALTSLDRFIVRRSLDTLIR
jgi:hypothetical protein